MKAYKLSIFTLLLICAAGAEAQAAPAAPGSQRSQHSFNKVPLAFEVNRGQAPRPVQFVCRGPGYALSIEPRQAVLKLEPDQAKSVRGAAPADGIRMALVGADRTAQGTAIDKLPGVVSYFMGNDPSKWLSGVPTYRKVKYRSIYPGIDLVFYGNQRQLEYDFVLAPGADPSRIAWQIKGARPSMDGEGNLILHAAKGPASFKKPVAYQTTGETRAMVDGSFSVSGNRVGFRIGSYDKSKPLVIDPVLVYASYLGGSSTDNIGFWNGPGILANNPSQGLAVDSAGSVYVTGYTLSTDFPTSTNANQAARPAKAGGSTSATSVFVSKFSPDGSSLEYSTYLGGEGYDWGYAIAVDSSGNAYVTGQSGSNGFPVTQGAFQTVCSPIPSNTSPLLPACDYGIASPFLTKLNSTGTGLVYSTFLGGYGGGANGTAVAVDSAGRAYIAGVESEYCSTSYVNQSCFPTTSGAVISGSQTNSGSPQNAFLAVFDPTGAQLLYSTLLGDLNGLNGGLGNAGQTLATGVAVDANGNFYLAGYTKAGDLPTTPGVTQPTSGPMQVETNALSSDRGMVAKFNAVASPNGASLAYATYFGGTTQGNVANFISGITADADGNAYILGNTNFGDIPVTAGAYESTCGSCDAAFVAKLNSTATSILWATYVGGANTNGSDVTEVTGPIALDGNGNVYIQILTGPGFPLLDPLEPAAVGGDLPLVVAELDPTGSTLLFSTSVGAKGLDSVSPAGMAVDSAGNIYLAGNVNGPDLVTTPGAFQTTSPDNIACCGLGNGFVARISPLIPTTTALSVLPGTVTYGQPVTFTATVVGTPGSTLVPTGTVIFNDANGSIGSASLNASGLATYNTSGLSAATYSVTAVYSGDANFMASASTPQTLVVNAHTSQTIAFGALPNVTYGVAPITLAATASSGLAVSYSVTGPAVLNGSLLDITGAGLVSVTASQAGNSDFSAAPNVVQSFTVAPAVLTVAAANASIAYGQPIPALTYAITGFVNGDPSSVVAGTPVESTSATASSAPGPYPIVVTPGTLTAANYTFSLANGTLTITTASQLVTFSALPNVTYGIAPIALGATASSGLSVSYSVTGPALINGSSLTITGAGQVTVMASQAGNADYAAAAAVQRGFTVSPALLTVKANSASMVYGQPVPALSFTITGLVNGDPASVVSGAPTESTTATSTSAPGTYPITMTQGTLAAANYSFSFVNATMTVSAASQTITFNAISPQTVGTLSLSASASSGLPVSFASLTTSVCTVSGATANLSVPGTCTIQASQAGNADYQAAPPVSQSFQVSAALAQGFTITPVPPSETVTRGSIAAFVLELNSINNFKGNVKLACSSLPAGSYCVDFPQTVSLNKEAIAVSGVMFPKTTPPGTYTITFTGTSGSILATATAKFTVK